MGSSDRIDVWAQKEFASCGINVGFMLLRSSPSTKKLVEAVREETLAKNAMEQGVLNNLVLAGETCGARVRRLPSSFWASSNTTGAPALSSLLLHHANFIHGSQRGVSTDPAPKLAQLRRVQDLRERQDEAAWQAFVKGKKYTHTHTHTHIHSCMHVPVFFDSASLYI